MTDFAPLGFKIDTAPLAQAAADARAVATEMSKAADASDKAADAVTKKAAATKRASDEARRAAQEGAAAAAEENKAADAGAAASRRKARAAKEATDAKRDETDATRQAADSALKEAEAVQKAAAGAEALARAKQITSENTRRASERISEAAARATSFAQSASAAIGTTTGLAQAMQGPGGLATAATGLSGALTRIAPLLGGIAGPAGIAVGAVAATGVAFYTAQTFLAGYEDRLRSIDSRLQNTFSASAARAGSLRRELQTLSQDTGLGFDSSTETFLRLGRNRGAIGARTSEIMQLGDLSSKLGVVSGASGFEVQSGVLQLSQALASGRLQGDELRSIMESMPALAKAIADGLGVSVGELRNMGSEGQLTSDKVFGAILKQAEQINAEFAAMPDTVERATQRLSDSFSRLLGNLGQRLNSSGTVQAVVGAANSVVAAAANATTVDPQQEILDRLASTEKSIEARRRYLAAAEERAASGPSILRDGIFGSQAQLDSQVQRQRAELEALQRQSEALQRRLYQPMADPEATTKRDAAVDRAIALSKETLRLDAAQKEATTTSRTLREGIDALASGMTKYSPDEAAKKTDQLTRALLANEAQAEKSLTALQLFGIETQRMTNLRLRYGADDIGFGQEVAGLADSLKAQGERADPRALAASVTARRLEEARAKAEQEATALERLRERARAAGVSREAMIGEEAAQAKAMELGATVAATDAGRAIIEQARRAAIETQRVNEQLRDAQSEFAPDPRATGDVRREMERMQRSLETLQGMQGLSSASRARRQFEADLAEDLRSIPSGQQDSFATLRRRLFDEQQSDRASQILVTARENTEQLTRAANVQTQAIGRSRAEAAGLNEALRIYNQLVQAGIAVTPELAQQIEAQAQAFAQAQDAMERAQARRQTDEQNRTSGYRLEAIQREIELIGVRESVRRRELAVLEATQQAREQRIEGTPEAEQARRYAAALSDAEAILDRQRRTWGEIERAGTSAIESIVDALAEGDLEGLGERLLKDITKQGLELTLANPIKNMLFGTELPTGIDVFNRLSGRSEAVPSVAGIADRAVGTMTVTASTVVLSGLGGLPGMGGLGGAANVGTDSGLAGVPLPSARIGGASALVAGASGGGSFSVRPGVDTNIDQRLMGILQEAAERSGMTVRMTSGLRPNDSRFHRSGLAADVQIMGPDGQWLNNYQRQQGETFRTYEQFAQTVRAVQMERNPELNDRLRWGGYFSGPRGKYGAFDLMHFDLGGDRVGMAGGSWEGGLTGRQRELFPLADSRGMGRAAETASRALEELSSKGAAATTTVTNFGTGLDQATNDLRSSARGVGTASTRLEAATENTAQAAEGGFQSLSQALMGAGQAVAGSLGALAGSAIGGKSGGAIGSLIGVGLQGLLAWMGGGTWSVGNGYMFAGGGYTGSGSRMTPRGTVHAGEYVFDAESTARLGARNLEALRTGQGFAGGGYAGDMPAAGRGGTGGSSRPVAVNLYNNGQPVEARAEENDDGAGGRRIDIFLDQMVSNAVERGPATKRSMAGKGFQKRVIQT